MVRRALHPAVLGSSLLYAAALYAVGLNAGILDIEASFWVVTVATTLLLSPLYHGFVLQWTAVTAGRPSAVGSTTIAAFPRLFVGQLLVGAGAVIGAVALIVPGVYFGVRAVLYKQSIVLEGAKPVQAVRTSFQRTADGKTALWASLALVAFYAVMLGIDALLTLLHSEIAVGILSVAVSGALLALLNALLTDLFVVRPQAHPVESEGAGA
ncbi:MAG: hypothetical protein PHU43_08635 [Candidatus Bipolaricaulis sp.]|nr:hypothetical protein [Candidatus Bipolaricaulis sp.]